MPETKICNSCKIEQPLTEFSKRKNKKTVGTTCKKCAARKSMEYRINNALILKEKHSVPYYIRPLHKICNMCNKKKSISEFTKSLSNKDGVRNYCKTCNSKIMAEYHIDHRYEESEKRAALRPQKPYRDPTKRTCTKCNIEKSITDFPTRANRKHAPRSICKKCTAMYCRKYRSHHIDTLILYNRDFYSTHKTEASARWILYYASNKEKIKAWVSNYAKTPTGRAVQLRSAHKRRTKLKNSKSTLTASQWEKILKMQNNRCAICNQPFTLEKKPSRDHIIPLICGGDYTFGNIQALCKSCNSRKGARFSFDKALTNIFV